jgi:hypothetical protein
MQKRGGQCPPHYDCLLTFTAPKNGILASASSLNTESLPSADRGATLHKREFPCAPRY